MPADTITLSNYRAKVLETDEPVLLHFWASWCCPSEILWPIFEEIAEEGSIRVGQVNYTKEKELAASLGVTKVPAILVIKNGEVTARDAKAMTKEAILSLLEA